MIPITTFAGKKVAVFGLGESGLIAASALFAGGADVVGWDDDDGRIVRATAAGIPTADLQTTPAFGQVSMPCTAGYSYKVVVRVTVVYSVGGKAESAARKVTSPTTKIPPTLGGRYNSCQEAPPRHH